VIYLFYQAAGPAQSVLASQSSAMMIWRWIVTNVANFTPGLQLCFVGILLCLLFLSRLVFGLTSLPLAAVAREPIDESLGFWRNCKALIFFLIGPVCQLWALLWVPMFFLPAGPLPDSKNALRLSVALNLLTGVALTLTPVLFFGKKAWNLIKRMLLLTEPRSVFFGLLVPIVISCSVSGAQFLTARAEWAHQAVRGIPPEFRSFFVLTWLNFHQFNRLVTGAFAEEIVFRGVLLALMTKRYGLHRGVFFTGIIWAAYHFPTDSYPPMSIKLAAIHVAFRILGCLAMNYVLAWMTMRWNSVIPSGFAHTVANVLIIAGVNPADFAWPLQIACWSVVAYVLWCYWPITEYDVPVGDVTPSEMLTNPQPAA
jgi:membrane protease YdiL (CAAX protease family)